MSSLDRQVIILNDGTQATVFPVFDIHQVPLELVAALCSEYNAEVESGRSFPQTQRLSLESFERFWFDSVVGVVLLGVDWEHLYDFDLNNSEECLGAFTIRQKFVGRSAHIATGDFLVRKRVRGSGVGTAMAQCFIKWSSQLGYNYILFDLVYDCQIAFCKIVTKLKFAMLGKISGAGILNGFDRPVDAFIFGKQLLENLAFTPVPTASEIDVQQVGDFKSIETYLKTGEYPPNSLTAERTRIRSRSRRYEIVNNQLLHKETKRLVVSDPAQQMQIASNVHFKNHNGINKVQSEISKEFFWTGIRDTVAGVIRECPQCRRGDDEISEVGDVDVSEMDFNMGNFDDVVYLDLEDDEYVPGSDEEVVSE